MKKIALFLCVCCAVAFNVSGNEVADNTNAVVTASRLNVRMKPTIKAPKAGVLLKDERVRITGKSGAWVELAAPESLKVYVSEVYLIDGKLTNAVNLRAGCSASAPTFGVFPAGTKLKAVGEGDKFGWVRVVAPESIRIYAYSDYIKADGDAAVKSEEKKAEAAPAEKAEEKKAEAVPVEKAEEKKAEAAPAEKAEEKKAEAAPAAKAEEKKAEAAPAAKAEEKKAKAAPAAKKSSNEELAESLNSIGAKVEKEKIEISGTLIAIPGSTSELTNYAVVAGNTNQGYVCGGNTDLAAFNGKTVTVTGKSYRIMGWKAPIVVANKVTR